MKRSIWSFLGLRKTWPYLGSFLAVIFAFLFLHAFLDVKDLQQSLAQSREIIAAMDQKRSQECPIREVPACPEKTCPECPEPAPCPECEVCDPPAACTEEGKMLPNGVCVRPRLTVEGDNKTFWMDLSFHFPGGGWVGQAPVTHNGVIAEELARPIDDDLWIYLNQGPDRYRFRLRESEFGWEWVTDQTGRKKVAYDWRTPRISEGRVELGITICTTLRDW